MRNSGGPPPAPVGGYSPATAAAAAMPAILAGSKPVKNRFATFQGTSNIGPSPYWCALYIFVSIYSVFCA